MRKEIGLRVIGLAALLVSSTAFAQLQTQGMTVGSPAPMAAPPPSGPKPTRAACTKQAGEQHLRGSKRTAFIRECMKG